VHHGQERTLPPGDESATPAFLAPQLPEDGRRRRRRHHDGGVGAKGEAAQVLGPDAVTLSLKVNGAVRQVTVEPRVTLLDALRNHLD